MLKLLNNFGEVSTQGGYSNPVHFDLDARFDDELVQMLTLSCASSYVAQNVTITDSGDTADRYFFSVNGTSWADSVQFDTITDNTTFYIKAHTTADETAATLRDVKLLMTYELKPAATPNFYYSNPGEADLLAITGITQVSTGLNQSITGRAFYGGAKTDMINTPSDLSEFWLRCDFWLPRSNTNNEDVYIGHFGANVDGVIGMHWGYGADWTARLQHGKRQYVTCYGNRETLNHMLLHVKSGELIEMSLNGNSFSWLGNVNNGDPVNNIALFGNTRNMLISNVAVSSDEIDINHGFHRDLFSVETVVTAPVLNVRWQGANHQFYQTTKRTTPALTLRVGDKNFYAPIVNDDDALASAVKLLLDDTTRAITT